MTAGSGLIHAEVSSEDFKREGGKVEILQLWINLPARLKMTPPHYVGLQKDQIPVIQLNEGSVFIKAISGTWEGVKGGVDPLTDVHMACIELTSIGTYSIKIEPSRNIFFYVVKGSVNVNSETAGFRTLVEFENDGEEVKIEARENSIILFGHAEPFNEPIVAHGPFVMNSQEEIKEAIRDYQMGKMGEWTEG